MGIPVCRLGDIVQGTCRVSVSGHPRAFTGVWDTCSGTATADGIGVIRVGDLGHTDCGHVFQAVAGSNVGDNSGLSLHRVGDPVIVLGGGEGISISGSDIVTCE